MDIAGLIDLLTFPVNECAGAAITFGSVLDEAHFTPIRKGSRDDEPVRVGYGHADEGGYSDYDLRNQHDEISGRGCVVHWLEPMRINHIRSRSLQIPTSTYVQPAQTSGLGYVLRKFLYRHFDMIRAIVGLGQKPSRTDADALTERRHPPSLSLRRNQRRNLLRTKRVAVDAKLIDQSVEIRIG
ncbi:hypothetical protein PQR70_41400 [Paraburkholderia madseniana]|uniref:hypothetical protein n=1 Tax=Paraburkholderia madseniana TaxID=2599607 RepID=UPI0038B767A7